jgi:hypothetical protein
VEFLMNSSMNTVYSSSKSLLFFFSLPLLWAAASLLWFPCGLLEALHQRKAEWSCWEYEMCPHWQHLLPGQRWLSPGEASESPWITQQRGDNHEFTGSSQRGCWI